MFVIITSANLFLWDHQKFREKGPSFLFMEVPDIQQTIRALNGAEIVESLHDTFYGSKEVVAKEPGGHYVIFSQLPTK